MTNELRLNDEEPMTKKDEGGPYNALETYILVRTSWKMRKEVGKVMDVNNKVLFHLENGKWMDNEGMAKGEIRHASKYIDKQHFYIIDHLGQQLGSVFCTRFRCTSNIPGTKCVGRYSLIDPLGQVIAIAEPSDRERILPAYAIFSLDGRVFASVHMVESKAHYQLDILLPGLHPLVVLSYVWLYGDPMNSEIIRSKKS